MDPVFGVINEQGYLGEGFGFTEASDEESKVFGQKNDTNRDDRTDEE